MMITLRRWQNIAREKWQQAGNRGVVSVVTGGGKSIFALACYQSLSAELSCKALVVVPTRSLVEQWEALIETFALQESFTVVTNLKLLRGLGPIVPEETLLICDEAHRYGTEASLVWLDNSWRATLGLSATFERIYDSGVEEILLPNLGGVVYHYSLQEALQDDVVSKYRLHNIRAPLQEEEQEEYDDYSSKIGRLISMFGSEDERVKVALIKRKKVVNESVARTHCAVELIRSNTGRQTIVFCSSIEQAEWLFQTLSALRFSVERYHSKLSRSHRKSVLRRYLMSGISIIIAVNALDEGFDAPKTDMAIIIAQSNADRQRIQRIGRCLRRVEGKTADIFSFWSTEDERLRLEDEARIGSSEVYWYEAGIA